MFIFFFTFLCFSCNLLSNQQEPSLHGCAGIILSKGRSSHLLLLNVVMFPRPVDVPLGSSFLHHISSSLQLAIVFGFVETFHPTFLVFNYIPKSTEHIVSSSKAIKWTLLLLCDLFLFTSLSFLQLGMAYRQVLQTDGPLVP